jgi:hypothetical protein
LNQQSFHPSAFILHPFVSSLPTSNK